MIVRRLRGANAACRQYADALLAMVDARVATPGSTAALDHLEWCRSCADEFQELALAIVALRRFGTAAPDGSGRDAAWSRLRDRLIRNRDSAARIAWRWRTTMAGIAAGAFIVAAVVGPRTLYLPLGGGAAEPTGFSEAEVDGRSRQVEAAYIWQAGSGTLYFEPDASIGAGYHGPVRYPDGVQPDRKEVADRTTGHAPKVD